MTYAIKLFAALGGTVTKRAVSITLNAESGNHAITRFIRVNNVTKVPCGLQTTNLKFRFTWDTMVQLEPN